jgi:prepilin-type N-terminal cleavage/methylation domain-containing protein
MTKNKGFTLIEAVIVVALLGVMMVVITQFFLGSNELYNSQNAELDVNFASRNGLDDIDASVRQATQVMEFYDTHASGPTVLILEVPAINVSNQIIPAVFDYIVYFLDGNVLNKQIYVDPASSRRAEATRGVAHNITTLTFTYNDPNFVQVTEVETNMEINRQFARSSRTLNISSKSYLRN